MTESDNVKINKHVEMVTYIKRHVGDLTIEERQDILQILSNSNTEESKLQTKGGGTQIRYSDIPLDITNNIYDYINLHVSAKQNKLQHFPEG
jgi:hypothetical protein